MNGPVVIRRQAVTYPDGSLFGYSVHARVLSESLLTPAAEDRLVSEEFDRIDLAQLVGSTTTLLGATDAMVRGDALLPPVPSRLVVDVSPGSTRLAGIAEHVADLRRAGHGIALGSFSGLDTQVALLGQADLAVVDLRQAPERVAELVATVHDQGVHVIGRRADNTERRTLARELGVALVQAPLVGSPLQEGGRTMSAGAAVHMQLLRLLSLDLPEHAEIVRLVSMDPELSMRVLRTVNSGATGMRRHIDSVTQAVAILGPRRLSTVVSSAALADTAAPMDLLWTVVTRAIATREMAGHDVGYTVGLLSGVIGALGLSVESVVTQSGVSDEVAAALLGFGGPYAAPLLAALAHEHADESGVRAVGFDPGQVSRAYITAAAEALDSAIRAVPAAA